MPPADPDAAAEAPVIHRFRYWLAPARGAAVALAAILATTRAFGPWEMAILAAAVLYSGIRLFARTRLSATAAILDIAIAMILIGLTGGLHSNYTALALFAAVQAGLIFGPRGGTLCGALLSAGAIGQLPEFIAGTLPSSGHLVAWSALFPLAGITGGLASRIWGTNAADSRVLARVIEQSVDEERQRLARELHDGMAQALTHVRLELEFLAHHGDDEGIRQETARLARVVERATLEVRSTITGLRSAVSGEGLAGSLRSYLSDLQSLGGPEITFDSRGAELDLSPEIEAEVFRLTQEAVSNALRHAQASKVSVVLGSSGRSARLSIRDNGIGIGAAQSEREKGRVGLGLEAMRERARKIGAKLVIDDMPGGGTRVQLLIDLGATDISSMGPA